MCIVSPVNDGSTTINVVEEERRREGVMPCPFKSSIDIGTVCAQEERFYRYKPLEDVTATRAAQTMIRVSGWGRAASAGDIGYIEYVVRELRKV